MFGMSLSKLLALIGILIAVWTLFRWVQRVTDTRRQDGKADRVGNARRSERNATARREPDPCRWKTWSRAPPAAPMSRRAAPAAADGRTAPIRGRDLS